MKPGLTDAEKAILNKLAEAWQAFTQLPDVAEETEEFAISLSRLQELIAFRVAKRVDPDFWESE